MITPERVAAGGPWSASTVRYRFGDTPDGGGRRFALRRRELALAVLEPALEQALEQSVRAEATYRDEAGTGGTEHRRRGRGEEFREGVVRVAQARGGSTTIKQIAVDLGVSES